MKSKGYSELVREFNKVAEAFKANKPILINGYKFLIVHQNPFRPEFVVLVDKNMQTIHLRVDDVYERIITQEKIEAAELAIELERRAAEGKNK